MAEERTQRRLAAILAADVAGYSRLMGADEEGTLARLKAHRRDLLDPRIDQHRGRIVKTTGDGLLVEFGSTVDALRCALEIQSGMAERNAELPPAGRIELRIGINVGDVIIDAGDIYGDGVNVAARLEALAEPGGICVSGRVQEDARGRLAVEFDDEGEQQLKNIAWPVHVWRARLGNRAAPQPALPLPDKPSIAVLPFDSLGGDADQATFADGLTEDLITDLSASSALFVIARHSTFAYKGKSLDVRQISRDLGVRYLLEGSARRAAGRVRINVQLVDAAGGTHLWAERYDRSLDDMFAVQDEVTAKIVEALVGRLAKPVARNRPRSMEAYDLCVQARKLHDESPQAAREAHLLLQRAIALDPLYAEPHRWLALNRWLGWLQWGEEVDVNRRLAVELARKAVALDPNDAGCRWILGTVLAYERRWPESDAEFATALSLDPSHADAWAELSNLSVISGRLADGLEQARKAFRLNPYPPSWYFWLLGQAQYALGRYDSAVETLRKEETYRTGSRRFLAASLAQMGRLAEARREAELFLVSNPHFSISRWVSAHPFRDDAVAAHFIEGYRKAGLPD
jgi:TolB-like protein/Tfp pilus assembly protein PilF